MSLRNTTDRYGSLSIGMHWLMLLLLVAVYACIELREFYPRGSGPREALKQWHFMLGLAVFALVWLRLALRMMGSSPRIVPSVPAWQHCLAIIMHLALYAFMIAMPLLGWLLLSDAPTAATLAGAALIAGSGLYTAWRERVLRREITPPSPSSTV